MALIRKVNKFNNTAIDYDESEFPGVFQCSNAIVRLEYKLILEFPLFSNLLVY